MTEHHLQVARTARYYQLGNLSSDTRRVWFVCHGYGQLAAYFIRHFAFLVEADPHLVVIAPEGLSRFYLNGTSGRVGASWMTRDDRLHEIKDHIGFLNQLADHVLAGCSPTAAITVLGFSQGTATISHWLTQAHFQPARVILWAGGFPEDLAADEAQRLLQSVALHVVVGTEDQYVTIEKASQLHQQLRALGAVPQLHTFVGGHTLNRSVLERFAN
jgi:predicted esterase